jgi:type I restriction enzyme S subunit
MSDVPIKSSLPAPRPAVTSAAPWAIPSNWRWSTMDQVSTVVGGGTPRTERMEFYGGDVPWITPADLSGFAEKTISRGARNITQAGLDNSGARLMPTGTVLFSSRAPIGYVAIAANPVSTNQGFKSFILKGELSPDFVYYYLKRAKNLAVGLASGTTFLEISGKNAARIPIPIAPLDEQHRIVAEIEKQFTRLEAGVASLKRVQIGLKRYRASVLKTACQGRLLPTEAELARQEGRSYETGTELLARILKERRAQWESAQLAKFEAAGKVPKDDKWKARYVEPAAPKLPLGEEFPPLPEGWTWTSPSQLSSGQDYALAIGPFGSNLRVSDYRSSGVPVVFVRNIRSGSFEAAVYVSEEKAKELRAHRVEGGDLLVTKMGDPPGDACLYPASQPEAIITADCIKLRLSPVLLAPLFFEHAINSQVVRPQILAITKGVAQLKVSLQRFSTIALPLPPVAEQQRIVAEVERRLSVVDEGDVTIAANLKRAERLRQSILQRAFTGQLVQQTRTDQVIPLCTEQVHGATALQLDKTELTPMPKPAKAKPFVERRALLDVLGEAGPLTSGDLFSKAGFTHDSVDAFYEELRELVNQGRVREERPHPDTVLLKIEG